MDFDLSSICLLTLTTLQLEFVLDFVAAHNILLDMVDGRVDEGWIVHDPDLQRGREIGDTHIFEIARDTIL